MYKTCLSVLSSDTVLCYFSCCIVQFPSAHFHGCAHRLVDMTVHPRRFDRFGSRHTLRKTVIRICHSICHRQTTSRILVKECVANVGEQGNSMPTTSNALVWILKAMFGGGSGSRPVGWSGWSGRCAYSTNQSGHRYPKSEFYKRDSWMMTRKTSVEIEAMTTFGLKQKTVFAYHVFRSRPAGWEKAYRLSDNDGVCIKSDVDAAS